MFATDSTREVYQRKLQRWLQCGPSPDTTTLDSSHVEPHVDVAARSKMATANDVCNSHGNDVGVSVGNGTTASVAKLKSVDAASVGATAVGTHQKHPTPLPRTSKSETAQQAQPYSLTNVECGSGSFNVNDRPMKPKPEKTKVKPVAAAQPVATLGQYHLPTDV